MNKTMKVLVVDDEMAVVNKVADTLRQDGNGMYVVETCKTGRDAISMIGNNPFDLVISDLRLQGMSGLTLLQMIRANYPTVRLILMSGYTSSKTGAQSLRVADEYLTKPFEQSDVLTVARRAMDATRGAF